MLLNQCGVALNRKSRKVEPDVQVWETLANIEGDTEFVDAQFQPGEEGLPQVE